MVAVPVVDRDLDVPRAGHSTTSGLKRDHEAVAHPLHHHTPLALDEFERNLLQFTPDDVRGLVTELLVQLSRLDEIGEQHRDRALGQR